MAYMVVRKFAWWPKRVGGKLVWLCHYWSVREYPHHLFLMSYEVYAALYHREAFAVRDRLRVEERERRRLRK